MDVHIVPGMTVPTNLFAQIALRTTQTVSSVTAEFPAQTQFQFLGTTNVNANTYQLYQVQFARLGENKLTDQLRQQPGDVSGILRDRTARDVG